MTDKDKELSLEEMNEHLNSLMEAALQEKIDPLPYLRRCRALLSHHAMYDAELKKQLDNPQQLTRMAVESLIIMNDFQWSTARTLTQFFEQML
jgi:hypothetical protein